MNILTKEMRRSLKELDLGLKGELTITNDMEDLGNSLFFDQVKDQAINCRKFRLYHRYPSSTIVFYNGITGWALMGPCLSLNGRNSKTP